MHDHAPLLAAAPLLVAITLIDHRSKRIPDVLSLSAIAMTAAVVTVAAIVSGAPDDARAAVLGAISLTGVLGALHLIRPDGLGLGDVKLAITLGLVLGWARTDASAVALMVAWTLMVASAIGLATVAITVRRQRVSVRTLAIPFGPALCVGTTIVTVVGPHLLPT